MAHKASQFVSFTLLTVAFAMNSFAQGRRVRPVGPAPQPGVYATLSGTVSQLNFNRDAEIDGFLLNNHTLVHVGPALAGRIESMLHKGDNVQIAGLEQTSASGWQVIEAQSVQDRTSGKSLTLPQPGAAAPFSGSGKITQLNYGPDGAINGFLLDNGTLASVPPFGASNPSSIRVGASVAYSGTAHNTISGRTAVDIQTITVDGQSLQLGSAAGPVPPTPPAPPAPRLGPLPSRVGPAAAVAPPPPAAADQPTPPAPPTQPGRTDQPAPPPPPQS